MKKLLFLVNPISGSGAGVPLAGRIADALQGRIPAGHYDILFTKADVTVQALALAPHYETVVVAGGDGTLNRVARGLISMSEAPSLGIIPLGTGNDCARSLGILTARKQGGLHAMLDLILAGNTCPLDVFTLGQQHMFISYAGFGRDAAIAAAFDRLRHREPFRSLCKRGSSKLLYLFLTLACARQQCAAGSELSYQKADGSTETMHFKHSLCQVLITNIDSYGAGVRVSSSSRMGDGTFEVTIMRSSARWLLLHLSRFTGRAYDDLAPPGAVIQTGELSLYPAGSVPAQIDGEAIAVEPGARLNIRNTAQLRMVTAKQR
jgi:diacylglycerol kinase family enzyme